VRALIQTGQLGAAAQQIEALLAQQPSDPVLWEMRGFVALNLGDGECAVRSLERAVELQPGQVRWLAALGNTLFTLRRLREAEVALHQAFRLAPHDHSLMLKLAQCLYGLHKPDEAAMLARRLVSLDSVQPAAWRLLGQIALAKPDAAAALRALERASAQAPDDARVYVELAQSCVANGDLRRAHAALERARKLDPRLRPALVELIWLKQQLAVWDGLLPAIAELEAHVRLGLPTLSPRVQQVLVGASGDPQLQQQAAQLAAQAQARAVADLRHPQLSAPPRHSVSTPLRIGVLCEDFADRAAVRALVEVLERLRSQPVEVTLFATGRSAGGVLRKRLQAVWPMVELHDWPLPRAAQRVADAGLHVLLDASGGGGEIRSSLPILRVAGLQLAWPGLPATAAASWIDGIVGDRVLLSDTDEQPWQGEPAWRLDCCAVSLDTRIQAVAGLDRAAAGLPERGFIFAHLGGPRYYHPSVFDTWASILRRADDSLLWLAPGPAAQWTAALLRDEMLLRGIAATRVYFITEDAPDLNLARLALVGLVLDSFPLSAREQASLAALAGVPVLSLPGPTLASRFAASLNVHQQLADLNCGSVQHYIDTAVAIANNPAASDILRTTLKTRRGPGSVLDMQHTADALYRLLSDAV
jgi:predicted O-linked N-acetylglucosamine transferase (SPINDLY family)